MSSSSDRTGNNILLGVCGGIAAYKSAYLVREFVKNGFDVKVIMTESAKDFVGPLTFSTLSKNPVYSEMFNPQTGEWTNHIDLGKWADLFVIAPATANTLAKAAHGQADNLLLTSYLSATCPVLWAPAMDLDMYRHRSTQLNIKTLEKTGDHILMPESGELASGLTGQGRLPEPERIFKACLGLLKKSKPGSKKKKDEKRVLVTAGPTFEPIDPVRFIGNRSSGKMGFAIAESLAENGYLVDLVTGPTNQETSNPNIEVIRVESSDQMEKEALKSFKKCSGAVLSAAVADFKPEKILAQKRKKTEGENLDLKLIQTADIALSLKKIKSPRQFVVGFALETENELKNARAKMNRKGFDMIVLNSLNDKGAGFQSDTNKITILKPGNSKPLIFDLKSKKEVAEDIVAQINSLK